MPSTAIAGIVALVAGIVIGLGFAVAGVLQLARPAFALKARLESYAELPLLKDIELAEARLGIAERALDRVPTLQLRATRALGEIDTAREQIRTSLFTGSGGVGLLMSVLLD